MSFPIHSGAIPESGANHSALIRLDEIRLDKDLKGIDLLNYLTSPNVSYARPLFGIAGEATT